MKTSTITFRLSDEEKERLTTIASKKDIPVSQIIREAIRAYLQEEK